MKIFSFFRGWSFSRYFRLFIGSLIAIYGVDSSQYILLFVSAWFIIFALLNVSCCGTNGCSTSTREQPSVDKNEDVLVNFEEIN
ncbi:MAG: hypothetical protein P4L28_10490 [Paludibacteraceae bacterium]|nr:hypothetical protein [Paludibacteraceae bacterium]